MSHDTKSLENRLNFHIRHQKMTVLVRLAALALIVLCDEINSAVQNNGRLFI